MTMSRVSPSAFRRLDHWFRGAGAATFCGGLVPWSAARRAQALAEIFDALGAEQYGVVEGVPFVEPAEGVRLYGTLPSLRERRLYRVLSRYVELPPGQNHFRVALDAVGEFAIPFATPGVRPDVIDAEREPLLAVHVFDRWIDETPLELCEQAGAWIDGERCIELANQPSLGLLRCALETGGPAACVVPADVDVSSFERSVAESGAPTITMLRSSSVQSAGIEKWIAATDADRPVRVVIRRDQDAAAAVAAIAGAIPRGTAVRVVADAAASGSDGLGAELVDVQRARTQIGRVFVCGHTA